MRYLVLFMLSSVAYADDTKEEEPKVIYKERTLYNIRVIEVLGFGKVLALHYIDKGCL